MAAISELEQSEHYLKLWEQAEDGTRDYPPHSVYQLITSEINQMGKTTFALRSAEIVLERLHGRKLDPDNISFEIPTFMDRRRIIPEWDQEVLDEPQRVAGNRDYWAVQNKILAEELQTRNYEHKHALLPTPHSHLVDVTIANVCTSHAVITSLGHATIYALKRRQLERQWDTMTPKMCYVTFQKPSPELWHEYTRRREAFNEERSKRNIELVKSAQKELDKTPAVKTVDELVEEIIANPQKYVSVTGKISPTKVQMDQPSEYPWNRIQQAAARATMRLQQRQEAARAEEQA